MSEFFSVDFAGPAFASLGPAHIGALAVILTLNIALMAFRHASARAKSAVRLGLAIVLWGAEASWHLWNVAMGTWTAQTMLPLNACSILIWLSGLMLVRNDFRIYEFAYFLGIGGALQYLATPDLGRYGFPHFRFFQTFISHGLLLSAPIYMTIVEGFRPTWQSFKRVVIGTNVYLLAIFLVNLALGSNYLMLNAKPATSSLLDLLPAWPYYVGFMELIGLVTCLLLYLPFLVADVRGARVRNADRSR
ncbi:MAG: TIGR02206 family membrane protein [Chloroflexota bacterium]